jgi:CheY-like chemotaxis protein
MTQRRRVLVIDDEASIRAMFRDMLQFWGHEVDIAASGNDGVTMFRERPYDLVLTDYLMPGMTGFEAANAIRDIAPGTPVIMVTGSLVGPDLDAIQRRGFVLLRKPVSIHDLKASVERVLGPSPSPSRS